MRIEKVYKTSRGTFWSKPEAEKKVNRTKTSGSRPGDPVEYEPVQEVFVLVVDLQVDQGTKSHVFELTEASVK